MISDVITVGDKVDIRQVSQIENAKNTGELPHLYKSQVLDFLENGEIELSMPTENGRMHLLMLGIRYEFVFYTKSGLHRADGQVKERYKTDNQYMLRIALNTQLSKYQRREFYRLACAMEMTYAPINEEIVKLSEEEFEDAIKQEETGKAEKTAYIKDLSGGGIRFVSEEELPENGYFLIKFALNQENGVSQYTVMGKVIDSIRVEETFPKKYENRVEFILKDNKIREEIIRFIFLEERKSRSQRKG